MFGKRKTGPPSRGRPRGGAAPARAARRPAGTLETVVFEPGGEGRRGSAAASGRRLVDLCDEWLMAIVALRGAPDLPDPAALRARALELKTGLERAAQAAGCNAVDVESAVFSLVALFDESVLRGRGAARDAWISKSFQLELYGQHVAGEEFFTRLERLRRERESRIDALEVAYACLALGFVGRYGLGGPEKLEALIAEVERDVMAVRGATQGPLAPRVQRRDERIEPVGETVPVWLSVAVFVPAVVLVWLVVLLVSRGAAGGAARAIGQILGR